MDRKKCLQGTILLSLMFLLPAMAQKKRSDKNQPTATSAPKLDTVKKKGGMQPFKQLMSKAKSQKGLFTIHKLGVVRLMLAFLTFWSFGTCHMSLGVQFSKNNPLTEI